MDRVTPFTPAEYQSGPEADINHRTGARMAFLVGQHRVMVRTIQFADTKAGALLAVLGLVAARGPIPIHPLEAVTPFIAVYCAMLALSILFSLAVVFPRYPGVSARRKIAETERWSWLSLSVEGATPPGFANWASGASMDEMFRSVAESNAALASVILSKFWMMRLAFTCSVGVIVLVGVRIAGIA